MLALPLALAAMSLGPGSPAVALADGHAQFEPVDPTLPVPTQPGPEPQTVPSGADGCGDNSVGWLRASTSPYTTFTVGVPHPTVNGVEYQGAVHAWDVDGSKEADGLAVWQPQVPSVNLTLDLQREDGHTYGWYAATFDGTSYSPPTGTCYFNVDGTSPTTPVVTNPDFPRIGEGGTPQKSSGQPTTFTFSSGDPLPAGCTTAGTPGCQSSGLDHFVYSVDQPPGIGAREVPADAAGQGSVTLSFTWGVHTFYVGGVDAAGNHYNLGGYQFTVPWQLPLTNTSPPAVKGAAIVGSKVTADPGTWSAVPASYTYQWRADGQDIAGATAASYVIPRTQFGRELSVRVTADLSGYASGSAESAAVPVSATRHDHAGANAAPDGFGDLLTVRTSGAMAFQRGTGGGGFSGSVSATGWSPSVRAVPFGDLNGDGCNDVLVRHGGGVLRAYKPECGKALTTSTPYTSLGTDWEAYDALTSPGDLTGDGRADLLARGTKTGTLYLFPATSSGKLGTRKVVRTNWSGFSHIVGAGDLNGDGIGDVLARTAAGKVYRCFGRADGTLGPGSVLWTNWGSSYKDIVGVGDITGEGKADLVVRDKYGDLYRYSGYGNGAFGTRVTIATGWTGYTGIF